MGLASASPTSSTPLKLLMVEDNPADARLIGAMLDDTKHPLLRETLHVGSLEAARSALARSTFDLALLDLSLPDSLGIETVQYFRDFAPEVPVIVLTGLDDPGMGVEAIRLGSQDFFVKGCISGDQLSRSIQFACERTQAAKRMHQPRISPQDTEKLLTNPPFEESLTLSMSQARRDGKKLALFALQPKASSDSSSLEALSRSLNAQLEEFYKDEIDFRPWGEKIYGSVAFKELWEVVLVAERLRDLFNESRPELHEFSGSSSMGIGFYPTDAETAFSLISCAESALSEAQEKGDGSYRFLSIVSREIADTIRNSHSRVRRAIRQNEIDMLYQPLVDMANGEILGIQASFRPQTPEDDLFSSLEFVSLVNNSELVASLDHYALRRALADNHSLREKSLPLFLHLSEATLFSEKFVNSICQLVDSSPALGPKLILEVSEAALNKNQTSTEMAIRLFRKVGARVCLCDFGTGQSSLRTLGSFSDSFVKLDSSFISKITIDSAALAMTRAIISMAHSLRLKVIAPGVESEEQLDGLRSLGCDYAQGFFVMKPASLAHLFSQVQYEKKPQPALFQWSFAP